MNKFAKVLGVSVLSASILAACGTEENTVSTAGEDNGEQQEQEESQEQEQEEAAEASIDVKSENFGARKDSIDNVYAYYAAEITNTGDKPARIGDVQVNIEGADETIIGTISLVTSVPDVVMPGETAYLGETTGLDSVTSAEDVTNASVNIDFDSTDEEPMMLETTDVQVNEANHYPYVVTGTVKNPNDETADDVRLAAGLYDENDEFIGVLNGSIQVSLNPDGEAGFELNYPEIPESIQGEVVETNVKAYNWSI
ncbi:FxLYD domain-containing protein [Lentibacillus salinarum]|uniref:FxLYD domain-containing protein n=1 Tax=Lentibacillus salinarum TaxID=446820 RepID=A0ABW3ZTH0_9BACI